LNAIADFYETRAEVRLNVHGKETDETKAASFREAAAARN